MLDGHLPENTDLALRPILRRHLGDDEEFVGTNYHGSIIALRYCTLFEKGAAAFRFSDQRQDVEFLEELEPMLSRLSRIWARLSDRTKNRMAEIATNQFSSEWASFSRARDFPFVDSEEDEDIAEADRSIDRGEPVGTALARLNAKLSERSSHRGGTTEDSQGSEDDEDDKRLEMFERSIRDGRFWVEIGAVQIALSEIRGSPITFKRVDWRACSIARYSIEIWRNRVKQEPPKTVHADAPGPFGRFLEDILSELYTSARQSPPSARSAMRAFANITNEGAQFAMNW